MKILAAVATVLAFAVLALLWRADVLSTRAEKLQDKVTASTSTLASCRTASSTLEGQVGQQNLALADLRKAAEERAKKAEPIQEQAAKAAADDYQAANRLQQERTGGDPATAAAAIIDKELGL